MRDAQNISDVESLGVDWMGLIFAPRSPRFVSTKPAYLPEKARRVGVFVDADISTVAQRTSEYGLHLVQLHGHEDCNYIAALRSTLPATPVIKAVSIADADDIANAAVYDGVADYLLFDTKSNVAGGSGRKFDWNVLDSYKGDTPFLLSGGIGPDDGALLRAISHPRLAGFDLNSRFETEPAMKDINKLKNFLNTL